LKEVQPFGLAPNLREKSRKKKMTLPSIDQTNCSNPQNFDANDLAGIKVLSQLWESRPEFLEDCTGIDCQCFRDLLEHYESSTKETIRPVKDWVEDLYLHQNKSDADIAKILGISDVAVSSFRKENGIDQALTESTISSTVDPPKKVPMIIDRHPDQPEKETKERYIGYWAAHEDPAICHYAKKGNILPWPGCFVDTSWDPQERATVVAYLNGGPDVGWWRGYPPCRFKCGEINNLGTTDKGDGTYIWPAGFGHYLEVHGVRPPVEFIQHVLKRVRAVDLFKVD
jgi:hypothetical protein